MVVALFQAGLRSALWTPQEMAEFYRADTLLRQQGLAVTMETGRTDEGDPWIAFVDSESGDSLAHFARLDGRIVAMDPEEGHAEGLALRTLIDRMLLSPQQVVQGTSDEADPWQAVLYPARPEISCHSAAIDGEEVTCDGYGRTWSDERTGDESGLAGGRSAGRSGGDSPLLSSRAEGGSLNSGGGQVEISAFSLLDRDLSAPTPEGDVLDSLDASLFSDHGDVSESQPLSSDGGAAPENPAVAESLVSQSSNGMLPDGLLLEGLLDGDGWLAFQDGLWLADESERSQAKDNSREPARFGAEPGTSVVTGDDAGEDIGAGLDVLSGLLPASGSNTPEEHDTADSMFAKRPATSGGLGIGESDSGLGHETVPDATGEESRRRPETTSVQHDASVIVAPVEQNQIHGSTGDDLIFARGASISGTVTRGVGNLAITAGSGHDVVVLADAGDLYAFIKERTIDDSELIPFLVQIAEAVQGTDSAGAAADTRVAGTASATGSESEALRIVGVVDHDGLSTLLAGL